MTLYFKTPSKKEGVKNYCPLTALTNPLTSVQVVKNNNSTDTAAGAKNEPRITCQLILVTTEKMPQPILTIANKNAHTLLIEVCPFSSLNILNIINPPILNLKNLDFLKFL